VDAGIRTGGRVPGANNAVLVVTLAVVVAGGRAAGIFNDRVSGAIAGGGAGNWIVRAAEYDPVTVCTDCGEPLNPVANVDVDFLRPGYAALAVLLNQDWSRSWDGSGRLRRAAERDEQRAYE